MTLVRPPQVECDYCGKLGTMTSPAIGAYWGSGGWMLPVGWIRIEQNVGLAGAGTIPIPGEVDVMVLGRTYCLAGHAALHLRALVDQKREREVPSDPS